VWSVTNSRSPEVDRNRPLRRTCTSRDRVLRVEVLREEASVVSLKLPKAEVSKSLIVIDHEGGHASVDRELWEKALGKKRA
jgi:hypothetical protein